MSSPIGRTALAVASAAVVASILSPTAAGATPPPESGGGTAPVMVVLDASGSMLAADAPGQRIAAAKRAVTGLVGSLPSDARLGLEVYGTSTSSAASAKAAGCKDIKVVVPVGPVNRTSFEARVGGIRASGYTPIGESLRTAAAALPAQGPRSIVLVSDGEDTCAPPEPCAVAEQLKRQGVDLVVHTVGFKVTAAARGQLQCIARVTGGTYRDAPDGPSLAGRLGEQVQRALRPYRPVGTPISGTPAPQGAPQLEPGQYVDSYARGGRTIGAVGTAKHYAVALHRGETPYISATIIPPARRASILDNVQVTITLGDGRSSFGGCSFTDTGYDISVSNKLSASTAVLAPGEVGGPDWPKDCPTDGVLDVRIARGGDGFRDESLPVELALRREPPADAGAVPGPASEQPEVRAGAAGPVRRVEAGSSFNDAPLVTPGTYTDAVVSGETRFVKIHLGWGQRLAYRLTSHPLAGRTVLDGIGGFTGMASPVRERIVQDDFNNVTTSLGVAGAKPLSGSTVAPVRYTNREVSSDSIKPLSIEGDYYFILSTGFPTTGRPATVTYDVTLAVVGSVETGPRYEISTSASGPAPSGSAKAGGAGGAPRPVASTSPVAGSASNDRGVPTAAVVGGAGAAALLLGAGAVVFASKRKRPRTGPAPTAPFDGWSNQGGEYR